MPGQVVEVVDIGVQTVFRHQVLVRMAPGAQVGRIYPEESGARVLDVVDAVTIGADRDIRVIFLDQRAAVDAGLVLLVDLVVALPAGG